MTVHDTVAYVLSLTGKTQRMRLHRLLYYCQAWSLVWDRSSLFNAQIQAWASGPVIPAIWKRHTGRHVLESWHAGDPTRVGAQAQYTISAVVTANEKMTSGQLANCAQQEYPWLFARVGLHVTDRGSSIISHASMRSYYSQFWQPPASNTTNTVGSDDVKASWGGKGKGGNIGAPWRDKGRPRYDKLWPGDQHG